MSFAWYVCQTHPNAEAAARRRLARQNFACHLALRTNRTACRGVITERASPCFPGYLFVLLDRDATTGGDLWKHATNTRGVVRILPVSDNPIPILTSEVIDMAQAERDGLLVSGIVKVGAKLKVYRGALANQTVECLRSGDEKGLIQVLFNFMGAKRTTTMRMEDVTVL